MTASGLLPQPQILRTGEGAFALAKARVCCVSGLSRATLAWLEQDFPGMRFVPARTRRCSALISRSGRVDPPRLPTVLRRSQAYALEIDADNVRISAADAAGLWYAFQTLKQLFDTGRGGCIQAVSIEDWPVVETRGIHLDLKGYQFKFDRLVDFCRELARFKVNSILLEVEDKFDYACAPEVGVPEAYSAAQFRRLARACRALSIEVIPKLQCLGHVDYLLKHAPYQHLRENNHPYQFCPRHPESLALWKSMCDELVEALPGGRYLHVGADETMYLGECPVCRKHPKADTYVQRVQACLDHVKAHGRTPIMWDDILRNLHGHLSPDELRRTWSLGREAILMLWAYGYGGRGNEFPHLPSYLAEGMQVWGASGFSGCGPSWIQAIPPFEERRKNIAAWTQAAMAAGVPGVMCTGWGRIASADPPAEPHEACWMPVLYAAESTWSGRASAAAPFAQRVARVFFGRSDDRLTEALLSADTEAMAAPGRAPRNAARLKLLQALSDLTAHTASRAGLLEQLQMYRGPLAAGDLVDYRTTMLKQRAADFTRQRRARMSRVRRALSHFYEPSSVAAFMESRFGIDTDLLAPLRHLLRG